MMKSGLVSTSTSSLGTLGSWGPSIILTAWMGSFLHKILFLVRKRRSIFSIFWKGRLSSRRVVAEYTNVQICQLRPFLPPPRHRQMHGSYCLRDLELDLLEDVFFESDKKIVYIYVQNEYAATQQ